MNDTINMTIEKNNNIELNVDRQTSGGGTTDYSELSNKPSINNVVLDGNKTTNELGINIPDVSNFITKDVNNLTYYTKSSNLSNVATSGNYNDLSNKPNIPTNSDFTLNGLSEKSYNNLTDKPTIPIVPTNLSSFTDDLGSSPTHTHSQYLTQHQDISGKQDIIQYNTMPTASVDNLGKIVQFIGTTDTYTNGYYYKCVVDNNVYSWEQLNVQPTGTSGGTNIYYQENSLASRFNLDTSTKGFYIFKGGYSAFLYQTGNIQSSISDYTPLYLIYNKEFYNAQINDELGVLIAMKNDNSTYSGVLYELIIKKSSQTSITNNTPLILITSNGSFISTRQQSIAGEKIFLSIPKQNTTTAPTQDTQFTNKKYVDDSISTQIGNINTILATLTTPSSE